MNGDSCTYKKNKVWWQKKRERNFKRGMMMRRVTIFEKLFSRKSQIQRKPFPSECEL